MSRFVDSLDYRADNVIVAPFWEWKIVQVNVSKVNKIVPRYCQPTCPDYRQDSDFRCKLEHECKSFVFDIHIVIPGERVFDVLFATNVQNPHEGFAWRVGEQYFREMLGNKKVDKMIDDYFVLIEPPKEGFKLS
jgi:hypothetical protein